MHLDRYGIYLTLRKGDVLKDEDLTTDLLDVGFFSRTNGIVAFPSGAYSIGRELGSGTYGKAYEVTHTVSKAVFAVKVIALQNDSIAPNTIKESIMNILMERESKGQPDGPYVPRFYELVYDRQRNLLLMRIELLQGTLRSLYHAATPQENDQLVPETLANLAHMLDFFYTHMKYNHRDLKTDNVGFLLDAAGKHRIRLMDFGFSCLTWEGVHLAGSSYFHITDNCYLPSRDLTQILYELVLFETQQVTPRLTKYIKELLTFPLEGKTCRLYEGCSYNEHVLKARNWDNVYAFLNKGILNPKATPQELRRRMLEFLGSPGDGQQQCLPTHIRNPKTRRCVRRTGKAGRKVTRPVTPQQSAATQTRKQKKSVRSGGGGRSRRGKSI